MTRSTEECEVLADRCERHAAVCGPNTQQIIMADCLYDTAAALRDVARERDEAIAAMVKEREEYLCMSEQIAQYEDRYRTLRAAHERAERGGSMSERSVREVQDAILTIRMWASGDGPDLVSGGQDFLRGAADAMEALLVMRQEIKP